jgi:hypothetical protein
MSHDGEVSGGGTPGATIDAVDLELASGLNEGIENNFDDINGSGGMLEGLALEELVQRVIGHGTINRETNELCAKILNLPEVCMHPEVLPFYPSYNGE